MQLIGELFFGAEDKEAHRQEVSEGKAVNINPTLKNLVRQREYFCTAHTPPYPLPFHACVTHNLLAWLSNKCRLLSCRVHSAVEEPVYLSTSTPLPLSSILRLQSSHQRCVSQVAAVAPCLAVPQDPLAGGDRKQGIHEE